MPALVRAVRHFLTTHPLIPPPTHVLAAVSGGPDSSVMLHILAGLREELDFRLTVAHFHHGVRGATADDDEAYVRELADALGVECRVGRRKSGGRSDEQSLRTARYAWLAEVAEALAATRVAVAHTRDDQTETLFLQLVRGAGLRGLGGMSPERPLDPSRAPRLIRPLLDISRREVLAYAEAHRLGYRVDETNSDTSRLRNRLRRDVLPKLRAAKPDLDARMAQLAAHLREDEAFLAATAAAAGRSAMLSTGYGWVTFDRDRLTALPAALLGRVLREAYRTVSGQTYAPDARDVQDARNALNGPVASGALTWPGRVRVRWHRTLVTFAKLPDVADLEPRLLAVPGRTSWPATAQVIATRLQRLGRADFRELLPADLSVEYTASPKPLLIRGWRRGDVWNPGGGRTARSVSETLRTLGIPVDRRPAAPVLITPDDRVWWVLGAGRPDVGSESEGGERLEVLLDTADRDDARL